MPGIATLSYGSFALSSSPRMPKKVDFSNAPGIKPSRGESTICPIFSSVFWVQVDSFNTTQNSVGKWLIPVSGFAIAFTRGFTNTPG